ncbi:MAG: 50S ribosomal protein L29 [bacterium]|nr:50S ribosomal protein L29 [bacterium]
MKAQELRQKSKEELKTLLADKRAQLHELEFMLRQNKVKNVKELGRTKKDIARILTIVGL